MAGNWDDVRREMRRGAAVQRIARHIAWEQITRPRPMDLSRVPPSTAALTPEYLTAILCTSVPEAKVVSTTLGASSSGSSDRCELSVSYNAAGLQAGLPTELFHKCTKSFYTRLHLLRCGLSHNEANFYRIIQPETSFETPKCYHAALEERSYRSSIIMENVVRTKDARFFDVDTPFTRANIEAMLSLLARLHARYWESARLDSEFTWLSTPQRFSAALEEGMELKQLTSRGMALADSVIPSDLSGRTEAVWRAYQRAMQLSSQAPHTYLHGDPHLRNYYRTADGRVGLSDWQVTMKGSWSHDFAYTMLTSLRVDQRRAWEQELLSFYLNRLEEYGAHRPPAADAWELYRRQTLYTFVGWLVTFGFGALQPDMQPASEALEIIRRAGAAVADLQSVRLLQD
jgi:aminoglycoside phosphotransferase (APT) family kinase protein